MNEINELKEKLYEKYSVKEIAFKIGLSERQTLRLLNNKTKITLIRYNQLKELITCN